MSVLKPFQKLGLAMDPAARRLRTEVGRFRPRVKGVRRMLDLGSGGAPYARFFPVQHYITADLLAHADVRCDAGRLPFADRSFDFVLCTEMLEHVPDPGAVLDELKRVLHNQGGLILTTPLTWGVHEPLDFHRWTEAGLRRLLSLHGFAVAELRPRGGILLCLGALLLTVPWQIFGSAAERRWWQTALFALTYAVLMPVALLLALFDPLDRHRQFTQGYAALCYASTTSSGAALEPPHRPP